MILRAKEILEAKKTAMEKAGDAADLIQGTLAVLSLFPVVGDVACATDGLIDAIRGNWAGAGISFAAMIPIAGESAAVLKVSKGFAARLAKMGKAAKIAEIGQASKNIVKAVRAGKMVDAIALGVERVASKVRRVWPGHHAFPKYLGGAVEQTLKKLPRSLHEKFHAALDKWKGGKYCAAHGVRIISKA